MIRQKVEVELILTDKGNIRIAHGGGSALVPDCDDNMALIPFLQVALLSSAGIINKMDINAGDRIKINDVFGTVTEAKKTESFVTARMDDDGLLLVIDRVNLEKI